LISSPCIERKVDTRRPFPKERSRAPLCFHARQQLNSHAKTPLRTQEPDSSLAPNPEHSFCNIHIHDDKEQNGIPQNAETCFPSGI